MLAGSQSAAAHLRLPPRRRAAGRHPGAFFVWGLWAISTTCRSTRHCTVPEQRVRRLYTMLGQTWANLDHELRFVQQSLVDSQPDDLLLLRSAPCAGVFATTGWAEATGPPATPRRAGGPCAVVARTAAAALSSSGEIAFHWDLRDPRAGAGKLYAARGGDGQVQLSWPSGNLTGQVRQNRGLVHAQAPSRGLTEKARPVRAAGRGAGLAGHELLPDADPARPRFAPTVRSWSRGAI